jgi:hypothetical protein
MTGLCLEVLFGTGDSPKKLLLHRAALELSHNGCVVGVHSKRHILGIYKCG